MECVEIVVGDVLCAIEYGAGGCQGECGGEPAGQRGVAEAKPVQAGRARDRRVFPATPRGRAHSRRGERGCSATVAARFHPR